MEYEKDPIDPRENSTPPASPKSAGAAEALPRKSEGDVILLSRSMDGSATSGPVTISTDQLEAALERVIRKVFSAKIDRMIIHVIDQAVSREIERIQSLILKTDGDEDREA